MTKLLLMKIFKYITAYTILFFVITFIGTLLLLILKGFKIFNKKIILINILPLVIIIVISLLKKWLGDEKK